jgi:hypothetical protein
MDLARILAQLREELENLDAAILSLERLRQEGRRRGRPPKTMPNRSKGVRSASPHDDEPVEED